jgi:signal transduction histidine kinase
VRPWIAPAVTAAAVTATLALALRPAPVADSLTVNAVRVLVNPALVEAEAALAAAGVDGLDAAAWRDAAGRVADRLPARAEVDVVDLDGRVLFDSRDPGTAPGARRVDLRFHLHFDRWSAAQEPGTLRFAFPLLRGGRLAANAVFQLPEGLVEPGGFADARLLASLPALLGCAVLAALALAEALRLRSRILRPLAAFARASRALAAGDVDVAMPRLRGRELADFTVAFDGLRDSLRHAVRARRELETARREFSAAVAHDLRTPLSSIRAYVEGIQDGIARDPATVARYCAVIRQKAESLGGLIDDLFQQSLADLERLPVEPRECYAAELLGAILEPLRLQYRGEPVTLRIEEPLANALVRADARRVEQVVLNLVGNARRNTPDGGTITVRSVLEPGAVAVEVADTGRGIPEDELPFIFDRFFRGTGQGRDSGSGLGLSICRYIVERHGGRIEAASDPGSGATFRFTLPKA